jgi:RND family efflux transporter MFP subunit
MSNRKIILAAVSALALVAVGAVAYLRFWRAVPVTTVEAVQGRVAVRVTGPGALQARAPVTVSSRITASVKEVDADVGDAVKRGQLLALLDDRDLVERRGAAGAQQEVLARNIKAARAAVAKAQADLDLARSKQRRDAELKRSGFVSHSALETSEAALDAARANLDNARQALAAREAEQHSGTHDLSYTEVLLSHARIEAPIDGVVILRATEAGDTVVPGSPMFRLADPAALWIEVHVDESVVGRVRVGQPASIRLRTGETRPGKVARIAHLSDAATRELEVDVAFDSPPRRFAIDQEAEVTILAGEDSGIVVPLGALLRDRAGRRGVLVLSGGRTVFRPVETASADAKFVIVRKGLAAGERVVAPAAGVKAGVRVRTP